MPGRSAVLLVPTALFVALVSFYLYASGAPLRVHAYSVACLLLGFWLPAVVAGNLSGLRRRIVYWPIAIALAMLAWDASPLFIGGKPEPFAMARHTPWVYLLGLIVLSGLTTLSAVLVSAVQQTRN